MGVHAKVPRWFHINSCIMSRCRSVFSLRALTLIYMVYSRTRGERGRHAVPAFRFPCEVSVVKYFCVPIHDFGLLFGSVPDS